MIKNSKELKEKIRKKLDEKAKELIDNLDKVSDTDEFTIDTIEDIMTRFNVESKQITLETINEAINSFDEKKIIDKKNEKLKDYKLNEKEPNK